MKKILFFNTTKLTSLSALVLLIIFCAIGMSFTPEDGEGVTTPQDSTYVTGPRRSHWATGGCNSTTHSEDDFGKVIATSTGNGSVTLTSSGGGGVVSTTPTSGTSSTSVTIVWKCGENGKGANQGTAANHTRSFTFKATPNAGYNFAGWWDAQTGGTKVSGDETYTESQELDEWNSAEKYTSEANAKTRTLYARFKEPTLVTITFAASPNGSYTYTCAQGNGTINSTTSPNPSVSTSSAIALKATPAPGYQFYGWYTLSGTTESFISYSAEASVTLDASTTIYAKFIPSDAALFQVKGENATYYDLNVAAAAAVSSSSKVVLPTADGTLYNYGKDYTIPSGVSLVIPYESTAKTYTSPSSTYEKNQAFSSASQYRILTLASGANIIVAGSLYVMADLCSANGGAAGNGAPATAYGRIAMSENSTITINSGANLYCWGFITGTKGLVTVKNGGKVHEPLQHQNNPGGSKAMAWNSKAFFMNQYYVQNVESPIKMEYGAVNQVYALMYITGYQHANASLIGKDDAGMFALTSSNSYLIRTYNPATDRTTYDIYGNAKLNYISMTVYVTIDTRSYVLPITSNLSVKCHTLNDAASTFAVPYAVSFLPGAELVVDEGVNVNISSKLIIYDRDEWIDKGFAEFNFYSGGTNWSRSSFTPTRTYTRTKADLVDAKVDLNGTMNVSGSLYTTTNGAAIISSNGTGIINLSKAAPGNSNDIQYKSNDLGTSTNVPMTPAQLKNADGSYTQTAGAAANTTITYANGHWGWVEVWKDHDGTVLKAINTIAKTTNGTAPSNPTRTGYSFTGWSAASEDATKQEVTHTAQYDPIYSTVTFNANGHGTAPAAITNVAYNTTITAPTAPTAADWVFSGWYKEVACTNAWNFSTDKVTANTTLYAKWVAAVASVTPEGGSATYHATIADAFTTANTKTNPIVKILQDASTTSQITISAAMTIDLNDKMISATQASASGVFKIDASGKAVTIKDSGTKGKIDHTASYNGKLYGVWLTAGSLKIEGGKIYTQNDAAASNDYRAYGIWTDGSASSITMSDGTIEATSKNMAFGIYCGNTCEITMTGGEIYSHGNTCIRGIYTQGTTKLTDATITSTATSTDCRTFYIKTGTNLTINSGTYTATGATGSIQVLYQQAGKVTINGGRFSATDVEFIKDAGTTTIKGGYYVHDTNLAANCATNYHVLSLTGEEPYKYKVAEAYTVSFNANGHGTAPSSQLIEKNQKVTEPSAPSETGWTFGGWYKETGCTNAWNFASDVVTGATTLYAKWTPKEYDITYLDKDGAAFSGVHGSGYPTKHTYGTATNLVNPTKEGYNFDGWFTASACSGSAVTTLGATAYTADITLYAKWTVITCTITWKVDDQPDETTEVALGQVPVYPHGTPGKAQTNQNTFTFEGWSDGKTAYGKDETLPSVTGPATYTARFQDHLRYYTITWKNWDGTILETDEGETGKMQWGAMPSYDGETPTRDGDGKRFYTFKGWSPEVELVSKDQTYIAQYNMSITVNENDGPLEITTDETAVTTTVQIAGKLNVGAHLTTEDLILEATPSTSGEITGGGTITATRTFFDLSNGTEGFKARTWYAVAVPWGVIVPYSEVGSYGGVYLKIGDKYERQQLGKTYDLIYYDGESRAQGKVKAWRYVEDDQKEHKTHDMMEPGRAYMIYLTEDAEVIRFQKHSDSPFNTPSVEVKKHESSNTDYKSWNGIANPATYHADLKNVGVTYGQVYIDPIKKRYDTFDMSKKLVVGQPVFVQVPDETFKSYGAEAIEAMIPVSAPSLVRRRAKEQVSLTCYELMLAASDADVTDRVIVRMDEEKTENEYVIGQDLVKMGVSDLVPQMWINRYEKKMCVNTIAGFDNTADYPLSIFAPKKGEYDLFIDDQPNNETMLYLTYDGEAIWNLSYGGYVANLTKGTNTHYGLRIVKKAPQMPTGFDEAVVDAQGKTRKVMINETVYIIRGDQIYSADGQLVK